MYDESDEASVGGSHYSWPISNYGSHYFGDGLCGPHVLQRFRVLAAVERERV